MLHGFEAGAREAFELAIAWFDNCARRREGAPTSDADLAQAIDHVGEVVAFGCSDAGFEDGRGWGRVADGVGAKFENPVFTAFADLVDFGGGMGTFAIDETNRIADDHSFDTGGVVGFVADNEQGDGGGDPRRSGYGVRGDASKVRKVDGVHAGDW